MKSIFTRKGEEILVDDEDFESLSKVLWRVNDGYAARTVRINGKKQNQYMHRLIFGLEPHSREWLDHINMNRLDNRRENLRLCTNAQNQQNRTLSKRNTTGYKGVSFQANTRKYRVQIKCHGVRRYLGEFETADEAAHEYNKAAIALHGEFAVLNPVGISRERAGER